MDKVKKRIIIILIVAVMLIILLLGIMKKETRQSDENNIVKQEMSVVEQENEFSAITDETEYINIQKCLNQYISIINVNSTSYYEDDNTSREEIINNNIYNMLSENYINKNLISRDNVKNFVYRIEEKCFYVPIEIYKRLENNNVKTYAIYGVIESFKNLPVMESYLILNIDENNNTFSVEQLNNRDEMLSISIEKISHIEKKERNIYDESNAVTEDIIRYYILTYKRLALAYPEIVYNNYLDEEYKQEKFGTLEKYKEYITNNKKSIESISIKKYSNSEQLGFSQYIVVDEDERYYIFNVETVANYKIILDTYTVDIPQFLEQYEKANSMEKVGYNIQKCIDAINSKDYSYVYNKLDSDFKNNKYKTEESFVKDIEENLFNSNKVESVSSSNEGNTYIYKLNIISTEDASKTRNMIVIMQLNEGTDFVMSFSFE